MYYVSGLTRFVDPAFGRHLHLLGICIGLVATGFHIGAAAAIFQPQSATFEERINVTFGPYSGTDSGAAETITDINSFTSGPTTTSWKALSSTNEKGPSLLTSLDIGIEIIDVGTRAGEGQVNAEIKYQMIVYNKAGTLMPHSVPVRFKGFYALTANSTNAEIANASVALSVFPTAGGPGNALLVSEQISKLDPGPPVSAAFDETFLATIGSQALDSVEYTVRLFGAVRARVHATQYDEVSVMEGDARLLAFIDPEIFIDPAWEHAADFDLVFSANIEPFSAPIPLPASGWLLVSALGAGRFIGRRGKRVRDPDHTGAIPRAARV